MTESGAATFTAPDDYLAGIGGANVNLVLTGRGEFRARLTWLKLRHLQILRAQESLPRIAYLSLAPASTLVSFPLKCDAPPVWSGIELMSGDIVFHARGERSHQWTKGASQWGLISLSPCRLAAYAKALTAAELPCPSVGRVLRPSAKAAAHLLRLHAKACRLAETKPEIVAHREVAHALEQELAHALVNCLEAPDAHGDLAAKRRHAEVMVRFEEALRAQVGRYPSVPELCGAIGVPERTLRMCCAEIFGMGPNRYLRLRRLNMARAALQRADPATASVAKVAQRFQFSELGRFAAAYRAVFGEMPSETLRRAAVGLVGGAR